MTAEADTTATPADDATPTPVLQGKGLTKRYGQVTALDGADFELYPGEILAVIGDNGAGKSTLIKALSGALIPDEGQIFLDGKQVRFTSPIDARRAGIETVYQDLAVAVRSMKQHVETLSGGQRQGVAVARSAAFARHVVIMDEPTAALGVKETGMVLDLIREVRDRGLPVIVISHNMPNVFEIADRVHIQRLGRRIAVIKPREFSMSDAVAIMTGAMAEPRSRTAVVDGPGADPGAGIVAVAGEVLVDLVPADPDGHYEAVPGGSPANVAVGLARLGVPTRMLARLADDPLGRLLRANLVDNTVDLTHAVTAAEPTSLALVELGADGVAEYDFRVDGTADWQWTDAELAAALASDSRGEVVGLHSGSLALTTAPGDAALLRLMARARTTATVSYDPNCRPRLMGAPAEMLAKVHDVLALADVVKVSTADLEWLRPDSRPEDVVAEWLGRGPGLVVVTLGADGVVGGTAAGIRRRPARQVTVVDTVGAGDAFSAGLMAGLHRRGLLGAAARASLGALGGGALDALLDEAVEVAALACARRGADPPTYVEWQSARS